MELFKGVGRGRLVIKWTGGGRSGNDEKGEEGGGSEEGVGPGVSQEGGEEVLSAPRIVPGCRGDSIGFRAKGN